MTTRLLTRALLLVGLLLALSGLGPATSPASAWSCGAPSLTVERGQVLESDLEISGTSFTRGCPDPPPCTTGCRAECAEARARPIEDAQLRLRQGGRLWILDEVDADADGELTFTAVLPPGARPGRAVLSSVGPERYVVTLAP